MSGTGSLRVYDNDGRVGIDLGPATRAASVGPSAVSNSKKKKLGPPVLSPSVPSIWWAPGGVLYIASHWGCVSVASSQWSRLLVSVAADDE